MSNLWIGDYSSSQAIATLQRSNIKHVVCASASFEPFTRGFLDAHLILCRSGKSQCVKRTQRSCPRQ